MDSYLNVLHPAAPLTPEEVDAWQKTHKVFLPEDYKKFILSFNGAPALTEKYCLDFSLEDGDGFELGCTVEQFIPLGDISFGKSVLREGIAELYKEYRLGKDFVELDTLIPVAEFSGGEVWLSVAGRHRGMVYYCDRGDFGIILMYATFQDFLDNLTVNYF